MAYLGEEYKKLGFGMMRLPRLENKDFDLEQIKIMVDKFMAAGCTYFDTAFVYEGSEEATRKVLVERYPRESFQLASKNAAWANCKTAEDAKKQFDISLERTGAGYFDFYLLHNLGQNRTSIFDGFDMWNWALEKKAQGLIKHIGFSFHSTADDLDNILTNHPEAEFVQLQINYADWENASVQSRACYEVARKHNKPIIIMEPVKGGMLANPPQKVVDIFKASEPDTSPASWAIRFAASLEGVITVLSGMSNIAQMDDNLSYMKDFKGLTAEQREVLDKATIAMNAYPTIPCTRCNYCAKDCPATVGISGSFTALNQYIVYNNLQSALEKEDWDVIKQGKKRANECIECGRCEELCPQHIQIRKELKRVCEAFGI